MISPLPTYLHSPDFVSAWQQLVSEVFSWRCEGDAVIVPDLVPGRATACCLPFLSYSHLTVGQAEEMQRQLDAKSYLIRVVDDKAPQAEQQSFQEGDMVTMRLALVENVWMKGLRDVCRNQVRKAQKSQLVLRQGSEPALVRDFYDLYTHSMHGYGMPVFPRRLLDAAARSEEISIRFYVAYLDETPAAGIVKVDDGHLSWVPWGASRHDMRKHCPNHLVYWSAIEGAIDGGSHVFDFGRSPYGGATFDFKKKWGAEPVALKYLSSSSDDAYAQYEAAQDLWKRLPKPVVDWVGPRLCRYLASI